MSIKNYTPEEIADFFDYLEELRQSGDTNMYGAGLYLQNEFGMDRKQSSAVLLAWMRTYSRNTLTIVRAKEALRTEL